jgi:hypothetical protein
MGGGALHTDDGSGALTMGADINNLVTIGVGHTGVDNVGDARIVVGGDAIAAVSSRTTSSDLTA